MFVAFPCFILQLPPPSGHNLLPAGDTLYSYNSGQFTESHINVITRGRCRAKCIENGNLPLIRIVSLLRLFQGKLGDYCSLYTGDVSLHIIKQITFLVKLGDSQYEHHYSQVMQHWDI